MDIQEVRIRIHSRTTYVRASKKILDGRKSISISTLTVRFFLRLYRIETNRVENSAARSCYRSCDLESEIIRISRARQQSVSPTHRDKIFLSK